MELSLAISDYDHVRDLVSGAVAIPGVTLRVEQPPLGEIFQRALREAPWDAHEMSFGMHVARVAAGDDSLVAIPVFPSRMFRLSAFFVRQDSAIRRPEELRGKRIGDPDWAMTAGIYARGWLQHEVGVAPAEMEWVQAGLDAPGRVETLRFHFPPGLVRSSRPDTSLDAMLEAGEVDAVLSAQPPRGYFEGRVRRLVPEEAAERAYFARTGVFPIMHVVAIKRAVAEANPGLAAALMQAFEAAKQRSLARLSDSMASRIPFPWAWQVAEQARGLFGPDPWPYGVAPNRVTIDAFLDWCAEQGIAGRRVPVSEIF